jgi:hypothetical protein
MEELGKKAHFSKSDVLDIMNRTAAIQKALEDRTFKEGSLNPAFAEIEFWEWQKIFLKEAFGIDLDNNRVFNRFLNAISVEGKTEAIRGLSEYYRLLMSTAQERGKGEETDYSGEDKYKVGSSGYTGITKSRNKELGEAKRQKELKLKAVELESLTERKKELLEEKRGRGRPPKKEPEGVDT